ncbi:MAG: TonB-dependent receptor, partial [Salinisphaeraceae bacterium]
MLYPSAPWRPTIDTIACPRRLTGALLLAAAFAPAVQAQEAKLEPITVDSSRIERDLQDTPAAVGVIDEQDATQGRQGLQLDESLVRVPGVFAQNRYNFAQNLRVSIRGFGARSPFGIRGIKLLVDGIPETVVDGQSQSDAIDLTTVENIEVIRGPSSALYGNATGGVIDIDTLSPTDYPLREAAAEYGSFGYNRISARAAEQHDGWGYAL